MRKKVTSGINNTTTALHNKGVVKNMNDCGGVLVEYVNM